MARLDPIEVEVFWFISNYSDEHTHPPSVREIADQCLISKSQVGHYLDLLDGHGYIIREPGRARGITLTGKIPRL